MNRERDRHSEREEQLSFKDIRLELDLVLCDVGGGLQGRCRGGCKWVVQGLQWPGRAAELINQQAI